MCGDPEEEPGPPVPGGPRVTRRQVLQGGAAAALGAVVLGRPGVAGAAPAAATLAGISPITAAMHVHASYSEGSASWEQQYANAVAAGADVLWQTDHDNRARAQGYLTLLRGTFTGSTTGSTAQHAATFSASGPIRLLVEAAGTSPATQSLVMQDRPTAVNTFRTGIDGQTIAHAFGSSRLDAGARYECVLTLSKHPAQGGRPAGQYSLRYRFLPGAAPRRYTEGGGLVGVVEAALPANGSTVTLSPQADVAAIWPGMLAIDHCSYLLSFVVTSPRQGVVADVSLRSVTVGRVRHDAAGVLAAQRSIASTYSARYGITGIASEEISLGGDGIPHCNVFGAPPEYAIKNITPATWPPYYRGYVDRAHARGGVVSWNHPYGAASGPALTAAQQLQKRHQVFAARLADDFCGADVLEVGYARRAAMPIEQHLALWDTFSRRARFLTGNGVSDDHDGGDWRTLMNGFLTGLWATSTGEPDLVRALSGGRAYAFHPGPCPGLELDTLVDGAVPMGAASVSSKVSRSVAVALGNLPAGCTVELLVGPVDLTGQDPATTLARSWSRSAFGAGGTGTVSVAVDTSASCFVRPQVRRNAAIVAVGNPTWLLRQAPPNGIPVSRQG